MIYKIILGKNEIPINENEKKFFEQNQDKRFITLENGEIVNTAFVQGILIDYVATRKENMELKANEKGKYLVGEVEEVDKRGSGEIKNLLEKYKPNFLK